MITPREATPLRVYADTSVFGGVHDTEFGDATERFFELARKGSFYLVTSALVEEELALAPDRVRKFHDSVLEWCEIVEPTLETEALRDAFVAEGILTAKSITDAFHVALTVTSGSKMIVSWNFKHIVHFARIPMYNAVERRLRYEPISIHSPLEVIADEEEIF